MNRITAGLSGWLVAITLVTLSFPASALPKAAEHENAPVTFAADATRPKIAAPQKKPDPKKAKAGSPAKAGAHATPAAAKSRQRK